jgi:hypothetical protein
MRLYSFEQEPARIITALIADTEDRQPAGCHEHQARRTRLRPRQERRHVTIINARLLLERDGHLTITLPHEVRVDANDLTGALS